MPLVAAGRAAVLFLLFIFPPMLAPALLLLLLLLVVAVLEAPITVIELPLSCRQMAEERLKSECPSTRVIPLAALLHLPMWLKPRVHRRLWWQR